jgi:hypothetical protein
MAFRSGAYRSSAQRPATAQVLKAMAGAAFEEHMAEHEVLLARFEAMTAAPLEMLADGLRAWFIVHAIQYDGRLKAIFEAMRDEQEPNADPP